MSKEDTAFKIAILIIQKIQEQGEITDEQIAEIIRPFLPKEQG